MFLGRSASELIAFALSFLVAGTVHEFAHAYSAYLLGDDTAYRAGRVTLNPIAHIDPFGFIAAVFMGFGWAKPVPVNPRRMRQVGPFVGDMITSFAGPISNILLATITALLFRMGLVDFNAPGGGSVLPSAAELLSSFLILNLGLAFFNMLPISPLDGSHVIEGLLVPELKAYYANFQRRYGQLIFYGAIILGIAVPILDPLGLILSPPITATMRLLLGM